MKEITPEDILIAREKRVFFQDELRNKYNVPMISMRVNYPGVNKNNCTTEAIGKIIHQEIKNRFQENIVYENFEYTAEGPVLTMFIKDIAEEIKNKTVDVEEKHILGRCVDIDVYDTDGNGISRRDLRLPSRKCFICADYAQNCVRSRKHSFKEVTKFVESKYNEYLKNNK
ncbi:citrate lyase holo-[acyl-carrier protein] synthase [Clostridium rectalis]|uniref:citrate lyase holo-[acyl-carrier protein] synthase n=1 Tax=Clostridium rectalis TaxID=2040295 RepID=UPI0013DE0B9F|nr:citrate lyase holo-[acyl-carrier protein] synthase [Clostridium rectalis]